MASEILVSKLIGEDKGDDANEKKLRSERHSINVTENFSKLEILKVSS